MNYAKIRKFDVSNGPGVRATLLLVDVLIIVKDALIKIYKTLIMVNYGLKK